MRSRLAEGGDRRPQGRAVGQRDLRGRPRRTRGRASRSGRSPCPCTVSSTPASARRWETTRWAVWRRGLVHDGLERQDREVGGDRRVQRPGPQRRVVDARRRPSSARSRPGRSSASAGPNRVPIGERRRTGGMTGYCTESVYYASWRIKPAWSAAQGTRGPSCSDCSPGTRTSTSCTSPRRPTRARRSASLYPSLGVGVSRARVRAVRPDRARRARSRASSRCRTASPSSSRRSSSTPFRTWWTSAPTSGCPPPDYEQWYGDDAHGAGAARPLRVRAARAVPRHDREARARCVSGLLPDRGDARARPARRRWARRADRDHRRRDVRRLRRRAARSSTRSHFSEVDESVSAYGVLTHRHTAEMELALTPGRRHARCRCCSRRTSCRWCAGSTPPAMPGRRSTGSRPRRCSRPTASSTRASRSSRVVDEPPPTKATTGGNGAPRHGALRRAHRLGARDRRARQPGQGCVGPGHPERQPAARPARDRRPHAIGMWP